MLRGPGFSDTLRTQTDGVGRRIFAHPFLRELEAGTLPMEVFRFSICQDFQFLGGFARAVGMALAKAPDSQTLLLLSQRVSTPAERQLYKTLFSMLDLDEHQAEETETAATTQAYINHLLCDACWERRAGAG